MVSHFNADGGIRIVGYSNNLWAWMKRASVFVSPSYFEGNPTTVLEAMAVGCPLVVSRIPEHEEILDSASAVFCNPDSAEDIARATKECLDHRERTSQRVMEARRRAAAFSLDAASQRYAALYAHMVNAVREQW